MSISSKPERHLCAVPDLPPSSQELPGADILAVVDESFVRRLADFTREASGIIEMAPNVSPLRAQQPHPVNRPAPIEGGRFSVIQMRPREQTDTDVDTWRRKNLFVIYGGLYNRP